jgi:2-dehydropantoate 2-reductase
MRPIRHVMIVGLGALGTLYAEKFSHFPDVQVSVLVDEARRARYLATGIWYNGQKCEFHYVLPQQGGPIADLILVSTKSNGLASALDMMAPFVGEDTLILSLMNGICSGALLAQRFGWDHVLYAMYFGHVSTNLNGQVTHDGVNHIYFGEADNTALSPRVARCMAFFDRTGVDYTVPQDMLHALWRKFMVIVGFNQSTVVFQDSYRVFQTCPSALAFARALMAEGVAVAQALDIPQAETLAEEAEQAALPLPATTTPSIYQDYMMHRQMEVDIFSGELCRLGRELGIPTPYNDAVRDILTAMNEKNSLAQP